MQEQATQGPGTEMLPAQDEGQDAESRADGAFVPGSSARHRRRIVMPIVIVTVVLCLIAGVLAGVILRRSGRQEAAPAFTGATETITRGDLSGETSIVGTLHYAESRTLRAAFDGVLTQVPAVGSVIHAGEVLYRVGDRPAFRMNGDLPAWRDFETGMGDGRDVAQLENGLRDLGYFTGLPDNRFDSFTMAAIMRWQKAQDLERTGRIELGAIVFSGADVRVGAAQAQLGDRVTSETGLYTMTSTTQVVDVNAKLQHQELLVPGNRVSLRIPGSVTTTGTIRSVGAPTEKEGSGDSKERVVPVNISPDDPGALNSFQELSITVGLPSGRRENVLSVPVGALLALEPDRFGVEIVESDGATRKTPVETGLFAGGRVEISGDGIAAGQRVVVPQR